MPHPPVRTSWIDIATTDGAMGAFLALPPAGQGPGLVLFQEIFGVNEHIRTVAEQYALDGFVVLAPDVFWRTQPRIALGYEGADRDRGRAIAMALQPAQTMADIRATVAALRARTEVGGRRVGALGYCMGGRLAWNAAATAGVDAAVCYYGGGIQTQLELAAAISGPLQMHYAERDEHIPPEAVASVRAALAGKAAEVHVYPGAMHGFNCWARASYHAPSAALAHGRSLVFLAGALN
jgi:carboxymethylenebutenolidase